MRGMSLCQVQADTVIAGGKLSYMRAHVSLGYICHSCPLCAKRATQCPYNPVLAHQQARIFHPYEPAAGHAIGHLVKALRACGCLWVCSMLLEHGLALVCTQDESFLAKLDPVVEQLKADVPDAKYDRKGLAQLILQLRQFMENVMGKNVGPVAPLGAELRWRTSHQGLQCLNAMWLQQPLTRTGWVVSMSKRLPCVYS